jgi:tripartite-type tricarboxylate transporter receptor subunit TctC
MLTRCAAALFAGLMLMPHACADAVADFYKGRTINLIVGYGPGGGYDLFARLLARHLGRHVPGNPTVVVERGCKGHPSNLLRGADRRGRSSCRPPLNEPA